MTGGRGRLQLGRIRNVTARIRDVAAQAGVSTQTVSRALRGSPAVTPTTAARIRAAAEDLGYFEPRLHHGVGSSFGGDTGVEFSAGLPEGPGLGLSPGSSRQSSGLRVAVTFAIDT